MTEGNKGPEMSPEQIASRQAELLEDFCKVRGWDPEKLDARQITAFYETTAMRELLAQKHRRPRD